MYMGLKQLLHHGTRAGEVARYAAVAVAVAVLAVSIAYEMLPSGAGTPPAAQVTVHEGDTLWGLAQAYGPPRSDPRRTIARILEVNHLSSSLIRPGEVVSIPQS